MHSHPIMTMVTSSSSQAAAEAEAVPTMLTTFSLPLDLDYPVIYFMLSFTQIIAWIILRTPYDCDVHETA